MSESVPTAIIESVLHPTDFSAASLVAFHHALKAGLVARSRLTLLNVSPDGDSHMQTSRASVKRWKRWGLLPQNSAGSALGDLGVRAEKIIAECDDAVKAVHGYLHYRRVDLIVLATNDHNGRVRWLGKSVSQPIARNAWQMTLFVPGNSGGFVSPEDGSVSLNRILIPVAGVHERNPPCMPLRDWCSNCNVLSANSFCCTWVTRTACRQFKHRRSKDGHGQRSFAAAM
jgi:nucleotide-binding universal stress UspA family protein